jgi:hypothetical protein
MQAVSRRGLLTGTLLAAASGAASCSNSSQSPTRAATTPSGAATSGTTTPSSTPPSATQPTAPTTAPTTAPSTAPSATTPTPSPLWTPNPGELEPDIKAVAVAAAAKQAGSPGLQVFDAQYGGLLDTSASVLVVTSAGTFDVRLVQATPLWKVTEIHPSAPGPAAATVSAAATEVLADTRISLPPAAAADIKSGAVHDSVLRTLLTLSQSHELTVSVVRSGHPIYVFGTTRPSDHPLGRAVDIWRIDGHAVVDPATSTSLVDGLMRQAAALGSYNVGGPRQLSGPQFFSDRTHHDHVHLGFST